MLAPERCEELRLAKSVGSECPAKGPACTGTEPHILVKVPNCSLVKDGPRGPFEPFGTPIESAEGSVAFDPTLSRRRGFWAEKSRTFASLGVLQAAGIFSRSSRAASSRGAGAVRRRDKRGP